ncbi:MAG: XdhC family protein [Betaproteobacteria bacterium]|nr:XdhC family protein [Betaproteobacteria bacterium]
MQSLDLEVLEHARDWLNAGRRLWLVTVTQTFGASPRPPGSLMAMRDDGIVVGSVSGGCIEDDLVARRDEFTGAKPILQSYGVSAEEARRFGLPCGGQLEVVIEAGLDVARVNALSAKIAAGEVFARVVDLRNGGWSYRSATPTDDTLRNDQEFSCIHGPRWRMLIIGASEIARYLAEVAATLDFQVFICDPREEYHTAWRVAGSTFVDGMPDDAVMAFKPDGHTVIITVSHDPKLDDMALMEALKTDAFYIGAVGSKKTSDERRKRLKEFDLTDSQVARLHGPVGLAIGSRTPPEIAIAILAELVAARNGLMLARANVPGDICAA